MVIKTESQNVNVSCNGISDFFLYNGRGNETLDYDEKNEFICDVEGYPIGKINIDFIFHQGSFIDYVYATYPINAQIPDNYPNLHSLITTITKWIIF